MEEEAFAQGHREGHRYGTHTGYTEGFHEGFEAGLLFAVDFLAVKSLLSSISSSRADGNREGISASTRRKMELLNGYVSRFRLENVEDTEREVTLAAIKLKLREVSAQTKYNAARRGILEKDDDLHF